MVPDERLVVAEQPLLELGHREHVVLVGAGEARPGPHRAGGDHDLVGPERGRARRGRRFAPARSRRRRARRVHEPSEVAVEHRVGARRVRGARHRASRSLPTARRGGRARRARAPSRAPRRRRRRRAPGGVTRSARARRRAHDRSPRSRRSAAVRSRRCCRCSGTGRCTGGCRRRGPRRACSAGRGRRAACAPSTTKSALPSAMTRSASSGSKRPNVITGTDDPRLGLRPRSRPAVRRRAARTSRWGRWRRRSAYAVTCTASIPAVDREVDHLELVVPALAVGLVGLERVDPDPEREVAADALADRADHLDEQPRPAFERAAPPVVTRVAGRQELVDEVAVPGVELDAVEAGAHAPIGGLDEARDHPRRGRSRWRRGTRTWRPAW